MKAVIYKQRSTRIDHKKNKLDVVTHEALVKLKEMPPYNGDSTLRNLTIEVLERRLVTMDIEKPHFDELSQTA